ncbi:MAG: hypothetical protein JWO30_2219 [Fibrobacteres bacterium]|nr:hypothetical protein [Fibrobacterota bacterium]
MADGAMGYPGGLERRDFTPGALPTLPAALRRISWGAVFAGFIVSIMVSLVLALLGMAIGLGAVNPAEEANPFLGLGVGAAVWWVVSSLIALFCGGWVAARMAGIPKGFDGALHGVLAWGLVTLFSFYLLGSAIGRLVGGVGSMVGQGLSMMGRGAAAVAPQAAEAIQDELRQQGVTMETIKREGEEMLRQSGKPGMQPEALRNQAKQAGQAAQGGTAAAMENPQQASDELNRTMQHIMTQGKGVASQADRDAAVNVITSRTGKSRAEAEQIVNRWEGAMQQSAQRLDQTRMKAEQKAREWGQTAAAGMSKASLWTFVALLLGGISAALGGRFGIPKDLALVSPRPSAP